MVSCEKNGRQQTTHPPERTQNRPWNKFHRRTFTVSPLVINLLRWKMNAMPPLCWNTGQHTQTTQRNVRETCVKNVCFTTSSWQSAACTDREGVKLTIEKHLLWVWNYDEMGIFDSCLLSPKRDLTCVNRDFSLLKKVVTKLKRDLRIRSRKCESMKPYV